MRASLAYRISLVVAAWWMAGCAGDGEERVRVPEAWPRTTELLAEGVGDDRPLPAATKPLRRGPCGVPLALSPEGLMQPGGIRRVQTALVDAQLLAAGAYREGELDEATISAISELQEREQLPAVGLPTYATVRALGLELEEVFRSGEATCEDGAP